jgi:hypothetical protein
MPHLFHLSIFDTSITEIQDNAFRPLSGTQCNLTLVLIEDDKLKRIGNYAFEYWPSLAEFDLSNNTLNHISENVFNFRKSNRGLNLFLRISLFNNNFKTSSFEIGAFSKFKKNELN